MWMGSDVDLNNVEAIILGRESLVRAYEAELASMPALKVIVGLGGDVNGCTGECVGNRVHLGTKEWVGNPDCLSTSMESVASHIRLTSTVDSVANPYSTMNSVANPYSTMNSVANPYSTTTTDPAPNPTHSMTINANTPANSGTITLRGHHTLPIPL